MAIGDLKTEQGVKSLNDYLASRSYVEGYEVSQADTTTLDALKSAPDAKYPHALRWYNHIKSYGSETKSLPGTQSIPAAVPSKPATKDDVDDEDVDLFGSDDDDAEAEKVREERLKAYSEKKAKKPGPIAKSSVILDVKPWDDETDMKVVERNVRSIVIEGLVWGASKLVAVGFGIHKLQIMCVVEDEKVSIDLLQEEIEKFEEVVQSVDIAAFNKI